MQEEDPIDPFLALGDYGQTKAQATLDVLAANDRHLQTVVVHPAAIIGPFDYRPSKLGRMVMQVLRGRFPFRPPGSYNFVDVRDVARGEILAAQRGHPGRNYILSNETWTITDFLKEVCQVAGRIWRAVPLPRRVMEYLGILAEKLALSLHREPLLTAEAVDILHTNTRMSCERARRELGYLPRPLRQTLKDEINWFRLLHAI